MWAGNSVRGYIVSGVTNFYLLILEENAGNGNTVRGFIYRNIGIVMLEQNPW
jgi:hypothetical protein